VVGCVVPITIPPSGIMINVIVHRSRER